ncbi:hypothetical protein D3C83_299910 [compost metagenome]
MQRLPELANRMESSASAPQTIDASQVNASPLQQRRIIGAPGAQAARGGIQTKPVSTGPGGESKNGSGEE